MYVIGRHSGFKIFEPSAEASARGQPALARSLRRNRAFLERPRPPPRALVPITGSFICAHAPDYVGTPTVDWDEAGWRRLFADMAGAGLDTVVWQASAWKELREVYYRSATFKAYQAWNVVEPMLLAARAEGLDVFLGGLGSVAGWTASSLSARALAREQARQRRCLEELLVWRELFAGVYFSPETAFGGERDYPRESRLNRLYRDFFGNLKEKAPEKLSLMSPASKYHPGRGGAFTDSWRTVLAGVPLDILAPQDSIGCGGCALVEQPAMWRRWRRVAQGNGMRLWANIELFERRHYGGAAPFAAARPERVAAQLDHAAPWVEKCLCWEYLFFAREAEGASLLRDAHFSGSLDSP